MGWTLTNNGVTKSLADWGISNPLLTFRATGLDTLDFTANGKLFDSDEDFVWGSEIVIAFGAVTWFRGIVTGIPRVGTEESESLQYEVSGPWYYLLETVFQQHWKSWNTGTGVGTDVYTPHLLLNSGAGFSTMNISDQAKQIIQFAIDAGRPITMGTILPGYPTFPPLDEIQCQSCAEALMKELRWAPDAVAYWDYGTNPPTIHIQKRGDLAVDTLPYGAAIAAGAEYVSSASLKARQDLVRPQVVVIYEIKSTITTNGKTKEYFSTIKDAWPHTSSVGLELSALVINIAIDGAQIKNVKAPVVGDYLTVLDGAATAAQKLQWLKEKIPGLNDARFSNITLAGASRNPLSSGYAQEIVGGSVAPWMANNGVFINAEEDFINLTLSYDVQNVNPLTLLPEGAAQHVSNIVYAFKFNATDSPDGETTYFAREELITSDPIPSNLAKFLYNALSDLQYDGQMQLTQNEASQTGRPGKVINITGGRAEWATARMTVQSKTENLETGASAITVGPSKIFGAQDLIELLKVARPRRRYTAQLTQQQGEL